MSAVGPPPLPTSGVDRRLHRSRSLQQHDSPPTKDHYGILKRSSQYLQGKVKLTKS